MLGTPPSSLCTPASVWRFPEPLSVVASFASGGATPSVRLPHGSDRAPDCVTATQNEGPDVDGSQLRWMFTEMKPNRFHWKGWSSGDDGATWRLEQEILGRLSSVFQ